MDNHARDAVLRPVRPWTDEAIEAIGVGLLACTLPKADWTHAAHLAATAWIIVERRDLDPARDLPGIIRAYNEATGGVNSATAGYHETITQASLRAVRAFLAQQPSDRPLHVSYKRLLASPYGEKDWLFTYWTRETLFSVAARRRWVDPDIAPLPF